MGKKHGRPGWKSAQSIPQVSVVEGRLIDVEHGKLVAHRALESSSRDLSHGVMALVERVEGPREKRSGPFALCTMGHGGCGP